MYLFAHAVRIAADIVERKRKRKVRSVHCMLKRRQNGVVPDIGLWELPAPLMAELNSFYHCLPFALHELARLQGMAQCSSRRVRSEAHDVMPCLWPPG
jgi:hypothetical protein